MEHSILLQRLQPGGDTKGAAGPTGDGGDSDSSATDGAGTSSGTSDGSEPKRGQKTDVLMSAASQNMRHHWQQQLDGTTGASACDGAGGTSRNGGTSGTCLTNMYENLHNGRASAARQDVAKKMF
jgi:hypothetical protein